MSEETSLKRKQMAVNIFHQACKNLATEVNRQLFIDPTDPQDTGRNFYWVGDEIGDIADFDCADFLTPTEMVLILQHNVSYEQYAEWRDACLDHAERPINLRSWLMGARYELFEKKAQ